MAYFKNVSRGLRKVLTKGGRFIAIEPGEIKGVPGHHVIRGIPAGLIEIDPRDLPADVEAELELLPVPEGVQLGTGDLAQLDHDGDGRPGGSLPANPPALAKMTKAQLLAQAQAEGVLIEHIRGTGAGGAILADDIRQAIEAGREAA